MRTCFIALSIAIGLLVSCPPRVHADRVDTARKHLKGVQNEIRELENTLKDQRQHASTQQQALRRIETAIGHNVKQLRGAQARQQHAKARLVRLHRRRDRLHAQLATQRKALIRQIREAYLAGRQSSLKLLLNQQHPQQVDRMLIYYDYFNRSRGDQIKRARRSLAALRVVGQKIAAQARKLERLKQRLADNKAKLAKRQAHRQRVLASLKHRIASTGQSLSARRRDQDALQQVIETLRHALADIPSHSGHNVPFSQRKGKLPWPTAGRLSSRSGQQSIHNADPAAGQGVFIKADRGDAVHAIAGGRVVFADWMKGFGLLVIIDHGHGYMSLYGHNQALYKSTGDWVSAGDTIGLVGDSGGRRVTGLYFEIRRHGRPVNPKAWCSKGVRLADDIAN